VIHSNENALGHDKQEPENGLDGIATNTTVILAIAIAIVLVLAIAIAVVTVLGFVMGLAERFHRTTIL